jgi:hypothetical protein
MLQAYEASSISLRQINTLPYQKTQKQIVRNGSITGINATNIENYSLFSIFITQSITFNS